MAKVSSGESVQDKMQARLDKVRKREAENAGVVRMNLQAIRMPSEVDGRDMQGAACLIDSMGHIAKKVRLFSEGVQLAGDAG